MNRILLFLAFLVYLPAGSQTSDYHRIIHWHDPGSGTDLQEESTGHSPVKRMLYLDKPVHRDIAPQFPIYYELLYDAGYYPDYQVELEDLIYTPLNQEELAAIKNNETLTAEISIDQEWLYSRGRPVLQVSFIPLRRNPLSGGIEKLTSFSYRFRHRNEASITTSHSLKRSYAGNSVLSGGTWVKIRTYEDGIYRLTYNDLVGMGIENPGDVRIFGNGNRMLPKMNDRERYDDLVENRIYMDKGVDGIFGQGDYILFYGQGPVSWDYNEETGMFEHERNLYSGGSYYFVTSSSSGKGRIGIKEIPAGTPEVYVDEFDDYAFHEEELVNLLNSGRDWFGEHFKMVTSYNFPFLFPDIIKNRPARLKWRAAARSPVTTSFSLFHNSALLSQLNFPPVNTGSSISDYAVAAGGTATFNAGDAEIDLLISFTQNTASSEGWLDYLLLNVRRSLAMYGNQMHFRDSESAGSGQVVGFRLKNAVAGTRVWDISDPLNISEPATEISGNTLSFKDITSQLNQYIAFDGSNYLEPEIIGRVANQNLHGIGSADMIIISHPLFLNQADRLANHRQNHDGLDVFVCTPEQVYNEFSSGKPDVTAIRDFMKMLYDRAGGESEMPRYLLLFGKGSYDNRPGDPSATNFIPTYQSANSLQPTQSFVSDDFFGLLDDNEGEYSGLLDIGIGRLPVTTAEQTQSVINKIINYNTPAKKGDWQNVLCFIGDDGDNNIHMRDADLLAREVKQNYPVYNIEKIYLDAWPKIGTSLGQRYPDVNQAISERIRKGALIINYTGHGSELKLADENIVDINDVLSWNNRDRLPVFMTATCEFSRFDNPGRVSAGEMVILNPGGGGIALFSTTRLVYATPNFFLNQNFNRFVLEKGHNGREMRLGDVMRLTKINSGSGINKRNFTLLGDPSLKLAIPEQRVMITSVNESPVNEVADTLKALSRVNISGEITDNSGAPVTDFEGVVYHTVYDKKNLVTTLGNDGSEPFTFTSRNNIIYKGKASVTGGEFSFSFIVPKDIAYHFGYGKVSSFAAGGSTDAAGFFGNIVIGGSYPGAVPDTRGPDLELYMNDRNFVPGGMTDENPRLLAFLSDSSGINTVGSGIGHDITLIMNNDPARLVVLNDYYVADVDSYQSGTIEYPFSGLDEGTHTLRLKAWDVFNNSSEASLEFTVSKSDKLALKHVFNYPNPFTQNTAFHFEHNRPDTDLDVLIQVFTVSGKLVRTISRSINTTGFRPDPIPWDGFDDFGDRIGRGVYIYRIRLRSADGQVAEKYEKLVILK